MVQRSQNKSFSNTKTLESLKLKGVVPDTKYGSLLLSKFINNVMKEGKKSLAEKICYEALSIAEEKSKEPALSLFEKVIANVSPEVEVKSRRIGGSTYQVPVEVRPDRKVALAIRWIISFAKKRQGNSMAEKLAFEFLDAASKKGASIKKKEDTHKMAEANKAFAHYRW